MNLELNKILEFSRTFWNECAKLTKQWIRDDALKGKFQDGKSGAQYRSAAYTKYKANDMRKFGRGKEKIGKGDRLKGYEAVSITSKETSFVNLTVTGHLFKNITFGAEDKGFYLEYAGKDSMKAIGNRDLGRDVIDISSENQDKILEKILNQLDGNIRDWARKEMKITVTKTIT